jgi:hypothetical protein
VGRKISESVQPKTKEYLTPPPEKICPSAKQAGKNWGSVRGKIFARLLSAPKARSGWEAARPCVSKEAKPAKIDSLLEKNFCACPLKDFSIFAGFACRRQAASRWVGLPPAGRQLFSVSLEKGSSGVVKLHQNMT